MEVILSPKNRVSSPLSRLFLQELYARASFNSNGCLNEDEKCFEGVLWQENESIEEHINIRHHMRNFVNLKINELFGFTFQDYLDLTMYGAEILIEISREYRTEENAEKKREEENLAKALGN